MAVNKNNTRIQITITKKMAEWIKTKSRELGMQPSSFINWLLRKNIALIATRERPEDHKVYRKITENTISDKEWNDLFPEEEEQNDKEEEYPF